MTNENEMTISPALPALTEAPQTELGPALTPAQARVDAVASLENPFDLQR